MVFPAKGESDPRNYICGEKLFPGLMENTLDNRQLFPYIPCCYTKNQFTTVGSKARHYFYDEPLTKKTLQTQDIFLSRKIVPPKILGHLAPNVAVLFNTISTPEFRFMRRGVNVTKLSFIEAVLTAKGIVDGLEKNILDILIKERNKLLTLEYAASAKQELFDQSLEEIIEMMKTEDMRATRFVRLIEQAYNCSVFIFSETDGGEMVIPEHTHWYYKLVPEKEVILIYQHWGSESDVTTYPQCELIVKSKKIT